MGHHFGRNCKNILIKYYVESDCSSACMTTINITISEKNAGNPLQMQLLYILNDFIEDLKDPHSHLYESLNLSFSIASPFEISRITLKINLLMGSWSSTTSLTTLYSTYGPSLELSVNKKEKEYVPESQRSLNFSVVARGFYCRPDEGFRHNR